jgi:hypothetical protein
MELLVSSGGVEHAEDMQVQVAQMSELLTVLRQHMTLSVEIETPVPIVTGVGQVVATPADDIQEDVLDCTIEYRLDEPEAASVLEATVSLEQPRKPSRQERLITARQKREQWNRQREETLQRDSLVSELQNVLNKRTKFD